MTFEPMRAYMKKHGISYYYLANQGLDPQTLQRIRHDRTITTDTLGRLCEIMRCQPQDLIAVEECPHIFPALTALSSLFKRCLVRRRFIFTYILGHIVHFLNRTI